MKYLKSSLMVFAFGLLAIFSSCNDDDDNTPDLPTAAFVTMENRTEFFTLSNLSSLSFEADLSDATGDVKSYELFVDLVRGEETTKGQKLITITEFPESVSIPTTEIVSSLGLDISEIQEGDVFLFYGITISETDVRSQGYPEDQRTVSNSVLQDPKQALLFEVPVE